MSDDRAGSRVAAVLEGLALQNASGELEIDVSVPAPVPEPRASKPGPRPKVVSGLTPGRVTARA